MIEEAIKAYLKRLNMSQEELSAAAGISISQISHILTGKSTPRKSTIRKIASALGVTVVQLMLERERQEQVIAAAEPDKNNALYLQPENALGPRFGKFHVPLFSDAEFMVTMVGDSMRPRLRGGDIVACKWVPENMEPEPGKIYLIVTDAGKMIKRYRPAAGGKIILLSDSEDYPPYELDRTQIKRMARVIGVISLE